MLPLEAVDTLAMATLEATLGIGKEDFKENKERREDRARDPMEPQDWDVNALNVARGSKKQEAPEPRRAGIGWVNLSGMRG